MERIRYGMKIKKIKKKDFKKIDIERLVYRTGVILCLLAWIPLIFNNLRWHSDLVACLIAGWNLCIITIDIIVFIAGNKNYKYEMARLTEEFLNAMMEKVRREMEDGEEKETGITNNDK